MIHENRSGIQILEELTLFADPNSLPECWARNFLRAEEKNRADSQLAPASLKLV